MFFANKSKGTHGLGDRHKIGEDFSKHGWHKYLHILEGERKSKHKKCVGLLVYSGVKKGSTTTSS